MDQLFKHLNVPFLVVLLLLAGASDASAYIDPGTGSYLFQLVIAGGLAGLYTVRRCWSSVKVSLRSRFRLGARHSQTLPHGAE